RRARVVADVDRGFVRQPADDLVEDGQATDARVEEPDRTRVPALSRTAPDPHRRPAAERAGVAPVGAVNACAIRARSMLTRAVGSARTNGMPWLLASTTSRPSLTTSKSGAWPICSASSCGSRPPDESARFSTYFSFSGG